MKKILLSLIRKYALQMNNQAFTLVDTLFAFSIFIMIIFMISPIFQVMLNNKVTKTRLQDMEWIVFCNQIKQEIHMSKKAEVISGKLVLTVDTQTVIYERYENTLRRRVNFAGNETLLQHVSEVSFTLLNNGISINVKDSSGKTYTVDLFSFIDWNLAA
ncbi:MAG: competence type IV pilus minor pilin ComGF [Bacillota bacterium]|nr:competence type IV pilus minor pilin ComGF [Bacillota bacterium]